MTISRPISVMEKSETASHSSLTCRLSPLDYHNIFTYLSPRLCNFEKVNWRVIVSHVEHRSNWIRTYFACYYRHLHSIRRWPLISTWMSYLRLQSRKSTRKCDRNVETCSSSPQSCKQYWMFCSTGCISVCVLERVKYVIGCSVVGVPLVPFPWSWWL